MKANSLCKKISAIPLHNNIFVAFSFPTSCFFILLLAGKTLTGKQNLKWNIKQNIKKERQKKKHKNTKLQSKMYSNAVDMNIFSSDHSKVFFLSFSMFMKSKKKKN